mmetsp:Transcript_301/g.504  ORF Transcript_301/g.504 Transcript_301/m.504 type:complete len:229 (-) Transcript_301:472-1158(-)
MFFKNAAPSEGLPSCIASSHMLIMRSSSTPVMIQLRSSTLADFSILVATLGSRLFKSSCRILRSLCARAAALLAARSGSSWMHASMSCVAFLGSFWNTLLRISAALSGSELLSTLAAFSTWLSIMLMMMSRAASGESAARASAASAESRCLRWSAASLGCMPSSWAGDKPSSDLGPPFLGVLVARMTPTTRSSSVSDSCPVPSSPSLRTLIVKGLSVTGTPFTNAETW